MTPEYRRMCKAAAEKNAAAGLPSLKGTPAQVIWAELLRDQALAKLCADLREQASQETLASSWIDRRDWTPARYREHYDDLADARVIKVEVGDAFGQLEVRPPVVTDKTVFSVKVSAGAVDVELEDHSQAATTVLKGLSYRYNGDRRAWRKRLGEMTGPGLDRAAEVVASALRLGATVRSREVSLFELAKGTIAPEWPRWVKGGKSAFILVARDRAPSALDHIPGVRRRAGVSFVPTRSFESLVLFAEEHGFRWTASGLELLERVREEHARVLVVEPGPASVVELPAIKEASLAAPSVAADLRERVPWKVTTPLLAHQVDAVAKLMGVRVGALFLEMGLGKTLTLIELVCRRQPAVTRVIWACPCSVRQTIREELHKHTDLEPEDVVVLDRFDAEVPSRARWVIVGLESVGQSARAYTVVAGLIDAGSCVVVDESGLIKGPTSKRALRLVYAAARARYRYILNGTPISQGIEDLYAQFLFLDRRILGYPSFYSFSRAHLVYSEDRKGLITERKGHAELAAAIAPYTVQVRRADCIDLPPKTYSSRYCDLTEQQQEAYDAAKERFLTELEERPLADTGVAIYKLFTTLQLIVCGIGEDGPLRHTRADALVEVAREVPADAKVIVWVKYRSALDEVSKALEPFGDVAKMHGRQRMATRDAAISRWRESGRFLVATQVGAHGLNLTEATYMVFYANTFKASERLQSEDRAHRIGQTQTLHIVDIWACCGIESRVRDALARKVDALETFRGEVKANLRAMVRDL